MISTKTGDKGTSQWQTKRLDKDCPNFDLIGDIDELVSLLGVVKSFLSQNKLEDIGAKLTLIQKDLMLISSMLAYRQIIDLTQVVRGLSKNLKLIEADQEEIEAKLPPQTVFLIPSGSQAAAFCQLARALARRCERKTVTYFKTNPDQKEMKPVILPYLNRLSDYLYLIAKLINHRLQVEEEWWA